MIQIPLTPDKYQAALKHLMDLRPPDVESLVLPADPNPGQIVTPQISLTFNYLPASAVLFITVTEKHGAAHFASEGTIKAHLTDLLTGV